MNDLALKKREVHSHRNELLLVTRQALRAKEMSATCQIKMWNKHETCAA
jgi:hypothetical protein